MLLLLKVVLAVVLAVVWAVVWAVVFGFVMALMIRDVVEVVFLEEVAVNFFVELVVFGFEVVAAYFELDVVVRLDVVVTAQFAGCATTPLTTAPDATSNTEATKRMITQQYRKTCNLKATTKRETEYLSNSW